MPETSGGRSSGKRIWVEGEKRLKVISRPLKWNEHCRSAVGSRRMVKIHNRGLRAWGEYNNECLRMCRVIQLKLTFLLFSFDVPSDHWHATSRSESRASPRQPFSLKFQHPMSRMVAARTATYKQHRRQGPWVRLWWAQRALWATPAKFINSN